MAISNENLDKIKKAIDMMEADGKSQPEIQEMVNYAKTKYDITQPDNTSILDNAKSLASSTKEMLNPINTATNPKGSAMFALQGLQTAGTAIPMGLSGVSTTPLTEFGMQRLQGKSNQEALKQAGYAGAGDLATSLATGGLPPIAGKFASRAITNTPMIRPALANIFASIPKKSSEIAIKSEKLGQSIFKNQSDYEKLALDMQNKMTSLKDKTGELVGNLKEKFKNIKIKDNTSKREIKPRVGILDIKNYLENEVNKTSTLALGSSLDQIDLNKIKKFNNHISQLKLDLAKPEDLLNLKEKAHSLINSYPVNELAPSAITNGQRILQGVANKLKNKIDDMGDQLGNIGLKKANNDYHEAMNLQSQLKNVLGSKTQSNNESRLYNVFNREVKDKSPIVPYLKELNKLSPEISNKYLKSAAAEPYKDILNETGKSLLKYSAVGGGGFALAAHNPASLAILPAVAAAVSPKTHKFLAQLSNPVFSKPAKYLGRQVGMRLNNLGSEK
jgi:hypothetical protein